MQLSDLQIGDKATVLGYFDGHPAYKHQLLAMGLVKGVELTLKEVAPLGDPVVIRVKDYLLSLRKHEAKQLKLEKVN